MRGIWLKRAAGLPILGAAVAGGVWFAWPPPVPVDIATAKLGPMEVTVDDEAKTRVRHIYTVSAPVVGKVLRTPRHVGDPVTADETIVAIMQPTAPSFIDVRSRGELESAVAAAEAAVKLAGAEIRRSEAALEFSLGELRRAQALARTDTIAAKALDKAKLDVQTNEAALASAKAQLDVRRSERAAIAARLIDPSSPGSSPGPTCCIQIRAPVTGRVLRIIQESEASVPAGAPLIEIGDPVDLEIAAELLSTEAVLIPAGASVRIDGWGGPALRGRVARVDPAGFTKVSALGIEEQRVRTVIDFVDPSDAWARLGHEYRVLVHVTIWSADNALSVPVSALFRKEESWAVFAVVEGRARTTFVQVGRRNNRMAEILAGLSAGENVVLHPSDRIREGVRVARREEQ
ncbi:HlyD family efflux transporter periplasmic adaptor subunit [Vineibacter terrae]|uniref:HlyD family efflux transporter periplasmic adaptor subunit n=1 Tax=Vineibacter terrae TaxID=2586908 RepID=A0A5C8PID3_9HYPH|nr:HlyD family efflux transporter periplasmic adaptor subunit [Vineibacter terrae]TXL73123.1 HlyD family efflux transporter periplasmic adaptor subunit [Vineibacter terrae]